MDDYLDDIRRYPAVEEDKRPDTAPWHIHNAGQGVPAYDSPINFTMVNNLISALGRPDKKLLRDFLARYDERILGFPKIMEAFVEKGLRFYEDRILPFKKYRKPTDSELPLFRTLRARLSEPIALKMNENELQSLVFDISRENNIEPKDFFAAIYQVLLGQERGPRFGSFAKLVGIERILELIEERVFKENEG
jgi:lysyl-tRNA synthetase class 1